MRTPYGPPPWPRISRPDADMDHTCSESNRPRPSRNSGAKTARPDVPLSLLRVRPAQCQRPQRPAISLLLTHNQLSPTSLPSLRIRQQTVLYYITSSRELGKRQRMKDEGALMYDSSFIIQPFGNATAGARSGPGRQCRAKCLHPGRGTGSEAGGNRTRRRALRRRA